MTIIRWEKPEEVEGLYENFDEQTEQEILVKVLGMNEDAMKKRWLGKIRHKPKVGVLFIELRKSMGEADALVVVGRSEVDDNTSQFFARRGKFREGKAKVTFNGTCYFSSQDLVEVSLAIREAEQIWDNLVAQKFPKRDQKATIQR